MNQYKNIYLGHNKMSETANNEIAEKYQQKTDKEHILDNPDTYIGSVENVDSELYLFDQSFKSKYHTFQVFTSCLMKVL